MAGWLGGWGGGVGYWNQSKKPHSMRTMIWCTENEQKNILWCTERKKMCDWKGIHHKGIHHIMALLWWWSHGWAPQKSHSVHWFQPTFFKGSILQRILEVNKTLFFFKSPLVSGKSRKEVFRNYTLYSSYTNGMNFSLSHPGGIHVWLTGLKR